MKSWHQAIAHFDKVLLIGPNAQKTNHIRLINHRRFCPFIWPAISGLLKPLVSLVRCAIISSSLFQTGFLEIGNFKEMIDCISEWYSKSQISDCAWEGSDWKLGGIFSWREWSSIGTVCSRKWWNPHLWRYVGDMWMRHQRTCFSMGPVRWGWQLDLRILKFFSNLNDSAILSQNKWEKRYRIYQKKESCVFQLGLWQLWELPISVLASSTIFDY